MSDIWADLKQSLTSVAGSWASYAALGSFVIYLLGYLVIRFHLTVWGIGTDLEVLDERYLFAGAKFLVYLFSTIPILVLIVLFLSAITLVLSTLVALLLWLINLILPPGKRVKSGVLGKLWRTHLFLWSHPHELLMRLRPRTNAIIGIMLSVIIIQFFMRQCLFFAELLLAPKLPNQAPPWLTEIFLDKTGELQYYYFTALVAATILTCGILVTLRMQNQHKRSSGFLMSLLTLLVAIQFLFLPVNYGILVFDKAPPKVLSLGGEQTLTACENCEQDCQEAWLVWEGKAGMTYMVMNWKWHPDTCILTNSRTIVTFPSKDVKKTEISTYDFILQELFVCKRCSP
ncbi:MAG TPA: hypothetical protein VF543_03610 [Pyrinomonadaceae bacterium]|jgi:hypothetical protein